MWLHGLGDSADGWMSFAQDIDRKLRSAGAKTKWTLPTAPVQPVSCNGGMKMTSWMDLLDIPISPSVSAHAAASGVLFFRPPSPPLLSPATTAIRWRVLRKVLISAR